MTSTRGEQASAAPKPPFALPMTMAPRLMILPPALPARRCEASRVVAERGSRYGRLGLQIKRVISVVDLRRCCNRLVLGNEKSEPAARPCTGRGGREEGERELSRRARKGLVAVRLLEKVRGNAQKDGIECWGVRCCRLSGSLPSRRQLPCIGRSLRLPRRASDDRTSLARSQPPPS